MRTDSSFLKFLPLALGVLFLGVFLNGEGSPATAAVFIPADQPIRFTVLYDNYLYKEGTKADWGFSCLIEGTEKTILFDTGTQPQTLMHNVEVLGVDLKKVDQVVISHDHGDHTGGPHAALEVKPNLP